MRAINHIALNCRDRERQEAFYTHHFGFRRARVFNEGQPNEFVMLRLGQCRLELFSASVQGQAADGRGGPQAVGFAHLAIDVPDIEAAVEEIRRRDGIEAEAIIDCSQIAPGMKVCFFHDLEGNRIELMENYRDAY